MVVATKTKTTIAILLSLATGVALSAPAPAQTQISACPYTITAVGNYVVTRDLTTTGTCITFSPPIIGASLDLQGHSITGNGTGDGIVCLASDVQQIGCRNVVVSNGTVSKFGRGVTLVGGYNTVLNMVVQQIGADGNGVSLGGDFGNVVESVVASSNLKAGIAAGSVFDSRADNNGQLGIQGDVVSGSEADNNGSDGIAGAVITDCKAKNNAGTGLSSRIGVAAGIINSEATGNGGNGIFSNDSGPSGTAASNVIGNTVKNNAAAGIVLMCPASAVNNTASNNAGGDIVAIGSGCELLGNKPAP
jgi:hypothetical protein